MHKFIKFFIRLIYVKLGWCDFRESRGKYYGSNTWFEVGVMPSGGDPWGITPIQWNVCAEWMSRTHYIEWILPDISNKQRREWFEKIKPGDSIALYARAQYPGWENFVESATMVIWYALP